MEHVLCYCIDSELSTNLVDPICFCARMYREAIKYYEKALALSTRSLSTYAGLAYTYHLQVLEYFKSSSLFLFMLYLPMRFLNLYDIVFSSVILVHVVLEMFSNIHYMLFNTFFSFFFFFFGVCLFVWRNTQSNWFKHFYICV